jgi:superfamily II DNA or RNA helicase
MPAIYSAIGRNDARNAAIFDYVLTASEAGRCPLILTERREHLEALRTRFERFTRNLVVLHGGLKSAERREAQAGLRASANDERLVLATGRYLGEGFDDSRLDTLFLVMPVSWKGTLAQYVGRLHRDHDGKREVIVYDYVDRAVPVLARMAAKRETGYKSLGYVSIRDEAIEIRFLREIELRYHPIRKCFSVASRSQARNTLIYIVSLAGDVLGTTKNLEKIKWESRENRIRFIEESPCQALS